MPTDPAALLEGLTPAQLQAVTHVDGPALVIAGAGTGKTKVITHRIAYLIQQHGVAPEEIVALTFTDKAAREMEGRVAELLPYGVTSTTIATFHSYCADLLKRQAFLLGLDPSGRLMSTADEISFLRQHLEALPTRLYKPNRNPVEFLRAFISFMSRAKDEGIRPQAIIEHAAKQERDAVTPADAEQAAKVGELGLLYKTAERLYRENGVLAYGDLISYAYQALRQFPSALAEEQARIRYLLIDEFQDTNYIQSEVADLLAGKNANIFAVGDDDQAIYSFRGATLGNIMNFTTAHPQAARITLADNFRSHQAILDASYRLIQNNNPERLEITERIDKRLISHSGQGEAPRHMHFERGVFEYRAIAEEIRRLISENVCRPEEIAILIRAKSHMAGIEPALQAYDIPYSYAGDNKFFNLPIVQAVASFLRFLVNPDDDLNLFYCLTQPPFKVNERLLQPYTATARYQNVSLFELLLADKELNPALREALAYLHSQLGHGLSQLPSVVFVNFLHSSHLYEQLQEDAQQTEWLATFYEEIAAYETLHPQARLPQYVQHLDYLIATEEDITLQQPPAIESEGVQIMTIHKSKGLEFPAVFVATLVQGRFPSRNFSDSLPFPHELTRYYKEGKTDNLPEERRLAYVAMTRAKERLYLTSSELYEDRKTKAKLSPFVIEALGIGSQPQAAAMEAQAVLAKPAPAVMPPAAERPLPTVFSPSALDTYSGCPKRYEYQYVLKIKVPAGHLTNFGISVHETLRTWFAARQQGREEDLEAIYKRCWVKGGYENRRHEAERYAEGLRRLQEYVGTVQPGSRPVALEESCQIALADGNKIGGKIDRIDLTSGGSYKVIDYKTGDNPPDRRDLTEDIPLTVYLLSLEQQGKKVDSVELHYVMVGERLVLAAEEMRPDVVREKAGALIAGIHHSLREHSFPAKPAKIACSYCEYNKICPFRYSK